VILPASGVTWQNRGTSFSLEENPLQRLNPGRLPFHTIQPAMAELGDGRLMSYGLMGGEGQPQTQAAIFTRHVLHGQDLQSAVAAPPWLLGRTWGAESTDLKIESRFDPRPIDPWRCLDTTLLSSVRSRKWWVTPGQIVHHTDGLLEGASDPRSDGVVAAIWIS
jgi:oxamate amidohydrolase